MRSDAQTQHINLTSDSGLIAPSKGQHILPHKAWQGILEPKPWEYEVTAVIPTLECYEQLSLTVQLLQLQTVKPYILIIDTGSVIDYDNILSLECANVEIHSLRSHGWRYQCEPIAMACQLGQDLCRTQYCFQTHADVFLRRRDFLADWTILCKKYQVIGYKIHGRFGHSALMYSSNIFDLIKWRQKGQDDTESVMNQCLKQHNIQPYIAGHELHNINNVNKDFNHQRSYCSSQIYAKTLAGQLEPDMQDAMNTAKETIRLWTT